jgi:hypothetical protein
VADGNRRQVDQQLRDVALQIDVMAAAGAGQAGKNGRRSFPARITNKQRVLPSTMRFISRSDTHSRLPDYAASGSRE